VASYNIVTVSVSGYLTFLGGRFKKEVIVDGQSYLLLIRDEAGKPEIEVSFIILYLHVGIIIETYNLSLMMSS